MTTTTPPLTNEAAARHERLVTSVRALRTRAGGRDGARTLLTVGTVLVPLGFALIILGWTGASRSVDEWEQIPYLISGGLLGLGLLVIGGFCYFTYWQTRLFHAAQHDSTELKAVVEALERIEILLAERDR